MRVNITVEPDQKREKSGKEKKSKNRRSHSNRYFSSSCSSPYSRTLAQASLLTQHSKVKKPWKQGGRENISTTWWRPRLHCYLLIQVNQQLFLLQISSSSSTLHRKNSSKPGFLCVDTDTWLAHVKLLCPGVCCASVSVCVTPFVSHNIPPELHSDLDKR